MLKRSVLTLLFAFALIATSCGSAGNDSAEPRAETTTAPEVAVEPEPTTAPEPEPTSVPVMETNEPAESYDAPGALELMLPLDPTALPGSVIDVGAAP